MLTILASPFAYNSQKILDTILASGLFSPSAYPSMGDMTLITSFQFSNILFNSFVIFAANCSPLSDTILSEL